METCRTGRAEFRRRRALVMVAALLLASAACDYQRGVDAGRDKARAEAEGKVAAAKAQAASALEQARQEAAAAKAQAASALEQARQEAAAARAQTAIAVEQARQEAHKEGYAAGFEAARPGTGTPVRGPKQWFTTSVSLLGFLKVVGAIAAVVVVLIKDSSTTPVWSAKILATAFAGVPVFWLWSSFGLRPSGVLEDVLLAPAMAYPAGKVACAALGFSCTYLLWALAKFLALATREQDVAETLCVFLASVVLGLLLPLPVVLYRVPEHAINRYLVCDLAVGAAMGGGFYLITMMLRAPKSKDGWLVKDCPAVTITMSGVLVASALFIAVLAAH